MEDPEAPEWVRNLRRYSSSPSSALSTPHRAIILKASEIMEYQEKGGREDPPLNGNTEESP